MKAVNEKPAAKSQAGSELKPTKPVKPWQRWFPWAVTAIFAFWVIGGLFEPPNKSPLHQGGKSAFDITEFGKLPVVLEGRVQPIDSVARNTLLLIRGKSTVAIEPEGQMGEMAKMFKTKKMPAIEWLLETMARPEEANNRKLFRIDHPELKSLLKLPVEEKHFSLNQITANDEGFRKEAQRLIQAERDHKLEAEQRNSFEKAVVRLQVSMTTFLRLKNSVQLEGTEDFAAEVAAFDKAIPGGVAALKGSAAAENTQNADVAVLSKAFRKYDMLEQAAYPMMIPPADPSNKDGWQNVGAALKDALRIGSVPAPVKAYGTMITAYGKNQPDVFNTAVKNYRDGFLKGAYDKFLVKGQQEAFFNHFEFFIKALSIYLVGFLFACAYWNSFTPAWRVTALRLTMLAFIIHVVGLLYRMHLEGRPPVTNLYSSAIFVGFGIVGFGIALERIFKNAIALLVATFAGTITLLIAHNLSLDGDTMKLLQAVLDTNIWLATHVVVITLGYSAMFLAGLLAVIYVVLGFFTRNLNSALAKNLTRMVYGIVCFATLFSFVGTVLGGIWADQSWGRFWGWDPKENGALLIVIWSAVILHARWGGMIRERGMMAMAIFGNIVTSFSWFGVNMLGVGLHSYGFMEGAFKWLSAFITSQLILIALTTVPARYWRSFRETADAPRSSGPNSGAKNRAEEEAFAAAQKIIPENPGK